MTSPLEMTLLLLLCSVAGVVVVHRHRFENARRAARTGIRAWPQYLRRAAVPGSGRGAAADYHCRVRQRQFEGIGVLAHARSREDRGCVDGAAVHRPEVHDALVQYCRAPALAGTLPAE